MLGQSDAVGPQRNRSIVLRRRVVLAAGLLLIGGASAGALAPRRWIASWRGDLLLVEPSAKLTAEAQVGENVRYVFMVTNVTNQPLKVLGANTSCGCTSIEGLPMKLEPGERRELAIQMDVGQANPDGVYSQMATLLVNRKGPEVNLLIEARLIP